MRIALSLTIVLIAANCAASYSKKIQKTENAFYLGDFDAAVTEITPLAKDSSSKDRLLYYMEAGVIYHTSGDFETSNKIFIKANEMAEEIQTSITNQAVSFLLSDRDSNFTGENFERALIKFYLALNHLMLGNSEDAKRTFRKLEADLKEMKYDDSAFKQILLARYLDALVSEETGEFNDTRSQYKNLEMFGVDKNWLGRQRYFLAVKEGDKGDAAKYRKFAPISITNKTGDLVIILQMGKAPLKVNRGKLFNDREFFVALRVALEVAILSRGAGVSTAGVLAMLGTAENPIPKYESRNSIAAPVFSLNDVATDEPTLLTDYQTMAIKNFNENYSSYITKNVASIATKIVIAAVAANELSKSAEKASGGNQLVGTLGRFLIGAGAGGLVAATVNPDLRCWRTLPANFQVIRIPLESGDYSLGADSGGIIKNIKFPVAVHIQPGKKTYLTMRFF